MRHLPGQSHAESATVTFSWQQKNKFADFKTYIPKIYKDERTRDQTLFIFEEM